MSDEEKSTVETSARIVETFHETGGI